jgi:hypothetical protein
MPEREGDGPPYGVHASGVIIKALREIQRRAKREGRGEKVVAALRQIYQRLQDNPFTLGEPLYRLPGLRMQVRTCIVLPVLVDFAICEDHPLVFLKGVRLLTDLRT